MRRIGCVFRQHAAHGCVRAGGQWCGGRSASAGDRVTVVSNSTGLTRTVTASADGSYRLGQLPVGDYQLQLSRDGQKLGDPVAVSVAIGGTTTVNWPVAAAWSTSTRCR